MKKAREFWIIKKEMNPGCESKARKALEWAWPEPEPQWHVIEKSAYDALERDNQFLESKRYEAESKADKLAEALADAVSVYCENCGCTHPCAMKRALRGDDE